jgi:hypothetical protein
LNKLNTQGDQNEMVRAFILSAEYRNRFGSTVPFPGPAGAGNGDGMAPEEIAPPAPMPPCSDNDGDGFCDETECNPYDPLVYPGAPIYCNWVKTGTVTELTITRSVMAGGGSLV